MRWENNNPLKMNENITLFFRDIIFADLHTLYSFHFEVKLYKYVVLGWKECWDVFNPDHVFSQDAILLRILNQMAK